jgi:hypothetical protein
MAAIQGFSSSAACELQLNAQQFAGKIGVNLIPASAPEARFCTHHFL